MSQTLFTSEAQEIISLLDRIQALREEIARLKHLLILQGQREYLTGGEVKKGAELKLYADQLNTAAGNLRSDEKKIREYKDEMPRRQVCDYIFNRYAAPDSGDDGGSANKRYFFLDDRDNLGLPGYQWKDPTSRWNMLKCNSLNIKPSCEWVNKWNVIEPNIIWVTNEKKRCI